MSDIVAKFTIQQNQPLQAKFTAYNEPPSVVVETKSYNDLQDKPSINDVELIGNKTLDELGVQAKGDYALVEDIPTQVSELENDSNYATQTQVMQAIASIPQFSISIVDELPLAGEKMMLYLVPKEGANNDVYNEYIWIEQTSTFEFLGTTAVDLTNYVKNTDYATSSKGGVVKTSSYYGTGIGSTGILIGAIRTLEQYKSSLNENGFICKGTLNNVLAQYKKVSDPMTEEEYNALETKDANTLYLIEE